MQHHCLYLILLIGNRQNYVSNLPNAYMSVSQVYDGTHALWTEGQTCHPVNVYGSSKLEAEHAIQVGKK